MPFNHNESDIESQRRFVYRRLKINSLPTVLRIDGHRFFFFSNEGNEPRHIHVEHAESYAKFWLNPVELAYSSGFTSKQLTKLRKLVEENFNLLNDSWDEHFS